MEAGKKQWLVLAAGGIIFRKTEKGFQVLIVHRNRYNDYSLPKGKLNKGETFEDAATREVYEETGYEAEITGFEGVQTRRVNGETKITVFFGMRLKNNIQHELNTNNDDEVKETKWLFADQLQTYISYSEQAELILEAIRKQH